MITEEQINSMDYREMLYLRRHAPIGHPCFRLDNPLHKVFQKRWDEVSDATSEEERVSASKEIGW